MIKTVNVGGKEITLRASALTSFLYKKLFGKDIIKVLSNIKDSLEIDSLLELAYVMNLQANNSEALDDIMHGRASVMSFYEWLDQFEYSDLIDANFIATVTSAWIDNQKTSTNSKNQQRPQ